MPARFKLKKQLFKLTAWILGILLALLLSFHIWFVYHSEKIIEDIISWQSNGKLKAVIKKINISYLSNYIDIKDLTILNTDSSEQSTAYHFSTENFHLKIRSRWALIFKKQLLIDSIVFNSPDIEVTRKSKSQTDTIRKKILLAEELGNIYKTIRQSLNVLNLQRFEMMEGKITIRETGNNSKPPFRLSHIFLSIDKLNIDSASIVDSGNFIFSDRVLLQIKEQKILLPDNKSNITFKELMLDSKEKLIRIIKPGINILPGTGQKNSLIASAEKLNITGLDFNALYKQPLIKVDSVYIESPNGNLQIYIKEKTNGSNKNKKTITDSVLRHLPVAVNINHVVVQNANGEMLLHHGDKTTSFQTRNDNVSVVGVRISDTAENALDIDGFNYTIRNYIGYTPDSIYRFRLDSLQFIDNKIVLHHFAAVTVKKKHANLIRNYNAPRFEITGMDWISFIFDNHFKAKNAILFDPILNVEKNNAFNKTTDISVSKKSIYQTLSVMDSLLDLDQLQIINGSFFFKQNDNANLQMQKLNLNINANELTQSKSINQIINSVKTLSFDSATIKNETIVAQIGKSNFNNKDGELVLQNVLLNTANNSIVANLNDVAVRDFSFDNNAIEVNNIRWKEGIIRLIERNKLVDKISIGNKKPELTLNNIDANNTSLFFENEKLAAQIFLKNISANSFKKSSGNPFEIGGLSLSGNKAAVNFKNGRIESNDIFVRDQKTSYLKNIIFESNTTGDSSSIQIPLVSFIPDINSVIRSGIIKDDSVVIQQPKIFYRSQKNITSNGEQKKILKLPNLDIKNISVNDASVDLNILRDDNRNAFISKRLSLSGQNAFSKKEKLFSIDDVSMNSLNTLYGFNDSIAVNGKGNTKLALKRILYYPESQSWQMVVDGFIADDIDYSNQKRKNRESLDINNINAQNISARSADLIQPMNWLINNPNAIIHIASVRWRTDKTNLSFLNFQFNQNKKSISIDSFLIGPGKNKNDFMAQLVFRKDFMEAKADKINFSGVEMIEKKLHVPFSEIDHAQLNVYSDKLIPPAVAKTQPLPVSVIKKIKPALQIDSIHINNARIDYEELNAETKQKGIVFFSKINGEVTHVHSDKTVTQDSLQVSVNAGFLDSMPLHLAMKESYFDPLAGLNLRLALGRGDLRLLNPFLIPLVSMRIKSGYLEMMNMNSFGNDSSARGNMQLYYRGLKLDILDSGNLMHKKFRTKLLVFFANLFAIRKNNDKRQSGFNFARIRQKSAIAYFLKMIVEGAAGNVAPVSKLILEKQNKKSAKGR